MKPCKKQWLCVCSRRLRTAGGFVFDCIVHCPVLLAKKRQGAVDKGRKIANPPTVRMSVCLPEFLSRQMSALVGCSACAMIVVICGTYY